VSRIGQGRHFVPLTASPPRENADGPEQQAVRQQPGVVGPMIEDLWVVKKIRWNRKGDGAFRHPSEVRVNEDDVRQVREHPEAKSNLATVLDVLRCTLADDEADDGVGGRVHHLKCSRSDP